MFRKFESVIKTVLVTAAHCIILHMVVVFRCFYGTVNSIERRFTRLSSFFEYTDKRGITAESSSSFCSNFSVLDPSALSSDMML